MALQQIIDKKKRCGIFNPFCLVFFRGQILSAAPLKIVPSQAKIEKAQKNLPFLLCVNDEGKFVYINKFFAREKRPCLFNRFLNIAT